MADEVICTLCGGNCSFLSGTEDPVRCVSCWDKLQIQIKNSEPHKILMIMDKYEWKLKKVKGLVDKWRDYKDRDIELSMEQCADNLEEALKKEPNDEG